MEASQHRKENNTLRDALREALHSCGIWEIRLESRELPVTLETPADVYQKGSTPWAYLAVVDCDTVNEHFNQFFGLYNLPVVAEGENVSTPKLNAPEDAPEGADALDRPDDDYLDNSDDDEEDEDGDPVLYVEPTPEQYEAWAIDVLDKLISPRCLAMESAGLLIAPDNGN